jgi:hypothetical protein
VYTEDTAQTYFEFTGGTGRRGVQNVPFNLGKVADFAVASSQGEAFPEVTGATATQICRRVASPSPRTLLGNSFVDPFFKPPIRLSEQDRETIDHSECSPSTFTHLRYAGKIADVDQVYRGSFHPILAMILCGLYNQVRETAAFHQLLSFSSWHLAILRKDTQNVSSLQYAARANRELQRQICDPNMCTKVDLVMAILVFASSSVRQYLRSR